MSNPAVEMTGKRVGRWVVVGRAPAPAESTQAFWLVKCECGKERVRTGSALRKGSSMSCGCLRAEMTSRRMSTHGLTNSPTYVSWQAMHARCTQPKCNGYGGYGGRGIKVCDRWKELSSFVEDMDLRPSLRHQIDRIDPNGNYEPSNCRWLTDSEQQRNRRDNVVLSAFGRTQCLAAWVAETGMDRNVLDRRVKSGMTLEVAIAKPVRQWTRKQ